MRMAAMVADDQYADRGWVNDAEQYRVREVMHQAATNAAFDVWELGGSGTDALYCSVNLVAQPVAESALPVVVVRDGVI